MEAYVIYSVAHYHDMSWDTVNIKRVIVSETFEKFYEQYVDMVVTHIEKIIGKDEWERELSEKVKEEYLEDTSEARYAYLMNMNWDDYQYEHLQSRDGIFTIHWQNAEPQFIPEKKSPEYITQQINLAYNKAKNGYFADARDILSQIR